MPAKKLKAEKRASPDTILRRTVRELVKHHRDFLECQTVGATGDPADLFPEFEAEHRRLTKLIGDLKWTRAELGRR